MKIYIYDDGWIPPKASQNHKPIQYYIDENGCWVCCSHNYKIKKKRPQVKRLGKMYHISRLVYEHFYKEKIPEGLYILHSCDNKKCINPEHLRPGTQKENMKDMYDRNRQPDLRGSKSGSTNLTEKDVYEIKYLYVSGAMTIGEIAEYYPVNKSRVRGVVKGWKHVYFDYRGPDRSENTRKISVVENTSKLSYEDVVEIKKLIKETDLSNPEIGKMFGVGSESIRGIRNGRSWKHVKID